MKKIFCIFALTAILSNYAEGTTVDTKSQGTTLEHWWETGVGAGRVNEGLRAGWQEHLGIVKDNCGFKYVRMHGLFHDDMFVYFPQRSGKIKYNWQYIDDVYDRMLDKGVRPFVELAFFPSEMALENSKTQFWWKANVSVDTTKFDKWGDLVREFTAHVVDRYGLDEVSQWYFEVWNEPNLTGTGGFLHGTKSDYFRLYKEAANAVKSVSPRLRVGGPATSNFIADHRHDGEILDHSKSVFYNDSVINTKQWEGVWIKDFLNYCEKENLPVDFISTHPYPTDYALDPETGRGKGAVRYAKSLYDDISWLKATLATSKYPEAEIHLTEWSTSPGSRDRMHDMLPAAAYIIKSNLDCQGMANSLMYWTFTDVFEEKGGGEDVFHGGFGMINYQGIAKPSYHAYRMLHNLGDTQLYYDGTTCITRNSADGTISGVIFNYPQEFESHVPAAGDSGTYMQASPKNVNVTLTNLAPNARFTVEILDNENGNAYYHHQAMGGPSQLSREQTAELIEKSHATSKSYLTTDKNGRLLIDMQLAPWTCILIKETANN